MTTNPNAEQQNTPAPYFVAKAREVFRRAGGNPDNAMPLAAWAEAIHGTEDEHRRGVIVAEDGTLLAETRRTPNRVGQPTAHYTHGELAKGNGAMEGSMGIEAGLAAARLRRSTGQRNITIAATDVTRGAAKFIAEV